MPNILDEWDWFWTPSMPRATYEREATRAAAAAAEAASSAKSSRSDTPSECTARIFSLFFSDLFLIRLLVFHHHCFLSI